MSPSLPLSLLPFLHLPNCPSKRPRFTDVLSNGREGGEGEKAGKGGRILRKSDRSWSGEEGGREEGKRSAGRGTEGKGREKTKRYFFCDVMKKEERKDKEKRKKWEKYVVNESGGGARGGVGGRK